MLLDSLITWLRGLLHIGAPALDTSSPGGGSSAGVVATAGEVAVRGETVYSVNGRDILRDGDRVSWSSGMAIDADGSPRAYHPDGSSGLDSLAAAGGPGRWWGVVTDASGQPVVQGPGQPAPGYYVSTTAFTVAGRDKADPTRYLDSERVAYIAIPPELTERLGVRVGDLAQVSYQGRQAWAVVGDVGPRGKIGEGSIALAVALGIPSSPRSGGVSSGVSYAVWAGSGKGLDRAQVADGAALAPLAQGLV